MELVTLDEAWARLERHVPATINIPTDAWNPVEPRWLTRDVSAAVDLPPFSRSMMDGYAIHAADLRGDAPLRVVGDVRAGDALSVSVTPGQAVRVRTGAPVPPGTAAVVREEWVAVEGDAIRLLRPVISGESVQPQGDDARRGDVIARAGQLVDGQTQAVLRAAGVHQYTCPRPLAAAVLATGSELVTGPHAEGGPPPGHVYAATDAFLQSTLSHLGVEIAAVEHAPDDLDAIVAAAKRLAAKVDLLILTGGASVGDADYARAALAALDDDAPLLFERIWMRPGAPMLARPTSKGFAFGLSGNPAAAYVQFHTLVVPFVMRWLGVRGARPFPLMAVLDGDVHMKPVKHTRVLRGRLRLQSATLIFQPEDKQSSGSLAGLVSTNAIARMDGHHLARGATVPVAWTRGWVPSLGLV
ncbi:MAG: molybdopterin molybdotransferase MoeA [Alicyclobacillus mali]|uniref:molybdopterin molybdotransferase MoeA n=1 Tax=Alicyclobacillus mali (ex Roth et al. 2021) TaxID=1123961 RepID=UPI0023F41D9C|nr:molybdopterin molybdotransferase MoeA [Alicyclobacillus mali (ex Roth et al. 2021)]MCL6487958.1 molybdopterin molybdotransferase MoeA [Alicyclobacillus mali (ex Roth et al. 2021)]